MTDIDVIHNTAKHRFETEVEGHLAYADYRLDGGVMHFTSTQVPGAIGGRGIAGRLVRTAMDYAREQDYGVVPACSYVASWLERHPEYEDLRAER
jgi:predicted GNAT family acetyltransferase